MTTFRASLIVALLAVALPAQAQKQEAKPAHGISSFGDLKYPPGFKHFDYVNPDAPKGGDLRQWELETFDNLNPLILKGVTVQGLGAVYEALMEPARDEPDAMYGLVAETVEVPADRSYAAFNLNPKARWHDGRPITAEDVVFTFNAVIKEGHPQYQLLYRDVEGIRAEGPRRVVYSFKPTESRRDLPLLVAQMPIMSKAWFAGRDFAKSTLDPPMSSGPYKVDRIDAGRSITYRRVNDYWGRDLPVRKGRHNFDVLRHEYFRDRDIAFEAMFAGEYDFRVEITARNWATSYENKPPVQKGQIKRETLRDETPSGVQAFFLNTRREKLSDPKVRAALAYSFDYEWMNKTLFYGLYKRTRSMFENSQLAATGLPSAAEAALLEPFRAELPPQLFTSEFNPPVTDGSGQARDNLRIAQGLFREAGYTVRDGKLVNAKGEPFEIEFLLYEQSFIRVINPFVESLKRVGVQASVRVIDVTSYENRMQQFDYDIIVRRFTQPLTPGVEQRNYWGSAAAGVVGSFNFSGVRSKAADAMIEKAISAKSRDELHTAIKALDRVLTWNHFTIPQWYSGTFRIAYWDKFGRPAVKPAYDLGLVDTWWIDKAREKQLPERRQSAPARP